MSDPQEDPTKEEVDDFIKANGVDERAAADLRESTAAVQRAVLARGDLSTARNPSAALLVRIRDARVGGNSSGGSGGGVGLPTTADIDSFIKRNSIDRRTGETLRSSSPTVKRLVLAAGDLTGASDTSVALQARIQHAKAGGATAVVPTGLAMPSSNDVEDFIKANDVDQSSADQLRNSAPAVQRVVISRGDLRSARNPSSALLARIRDAKSGPPEGGLMPGMGMPGGVPPPPGVAPPMGAFPMPCGYPPMGFPPPGGFPPPPGDGTPGGGYYPPPGYGYPPPGYGGYPGFPGGYPPPGYGGYPGYPGYPPGGYPPGASGVAPGQGPGGDQQRGRGRSRSSSGSYSRSYSYSRSPTPRSRSRSRRAGGGRKGRAAGNRGKPKRK